MERYILRDGNPMPCPDLMEWAEFMEHGDMRIVERTDLPDDVRVSTVFLGIDHNFFGGNGAPILWETMIFGGPHDQYQDRYTSREDAVLGHAKAVRIAKGEEVTE